MCAPAQRAYRNSSFLWRNHLGDPRNARIAAEQIARGVHR
jgi:hypothetical protein